HLSDAIDQTRQFALEKAQAVVGEINDLVRAIAHVNERIVATESGGISAPDLRDERDRLLDHLASLVDIQVIERENGSVGVHVQGIAIVDGARANTVEAFENGGVWTFRTVNGNVLSAPGSALG